VGDDDACKQRLRSAFRAAVANEPVFARAVDVDDTCHALDEVAEYDALRDGFLVLPTLQSMYVLFSLVAVSPSTRSFLFPCPHFACSLSFSVGVPTRPSLCGSSL